jgi:hypothetical protein
MQDGCEVMNWRAGGMKVFTSGIGLDLLTEITKVLRIFCLCAEILTQDFHNTKEECQTLDRDFRFVLVPCLQQLRL